jgi:DNA repair protein RecN (Recombination protein N)
MLQELRVENLLLMQRAELRLGPGLNVLTGETGAGKTLLAHALDLLLGGRARRGIVRPGAAEAYVEGVFDLPGELAGDERIPSGAADLVLARRVWPDGRTRAYVCGRAATQGDLQELGGRLLSFYGQHEHRRLMLSTAQLELLDAFGGEPQARLRARLRSAHEAVRALEERAAGLRELAGSRDRELDLLSFELEEIEAASPTDGESDRLHAERDRLRHQEELVAAAAAGAQALAADAGDGAAELIATAAGRVGAAAELDGALAPLAARLTALQYEAADVAAELRDYLEGLAGGGDPAAGAARLQEIEERLALLARLERKHGGTVADVLAHAERCRARRDELAGAESDLEAVETELAAARDARAQLAERLSRARAKAAPRLAREVRGRLAELAMPDARFEIALAPREDGCGARGADAIEMQLAPNDPDPGHPLAPLREAASGGELSRVMLALLSVAHGRGDGGGDGAMLVFDEIDAGIGGHTARAVGEHLRALAAGRQVLCITHLPQVAALGERHFTIVKDTTARPATTTVSALEGDALVEELVRMMGAGEADAAAGEHARELLRAAAQVRPEACIFRERGPGSAAARGTVMTV